MRVGEFSDGFDSCASCGLTRLCITCVSALRMLFFMILYFRHLCFMDLLVSVVVFVIVLVVL